MNPTSFEIIARELCKMAGIDPDAISDSGEPNIYHMRTHAMAVETALANAGYEIRKAQP